MLTVQRQPQRLTIYRLTAPDSFVDLATATSEQLDCLAEACEPATFIQDEENIHDETHLKAGQLNAANFATKFDPTRCRIVDMLQSRMVEEGYYRRAGFGVRAELRKLNVYGALFISSRYLFIDRRDDRDAGEGAFSKLLVDAPHNNSMFASLVVVFPTRHEGGELVICDQASNEASEHIFDATALLANKPKPSVAYIAFYPSSEREILPVREGHLVTLTYDFYYTDDKRRRKSRPT